MVGAGLASMDPKVAALATAGVAAIFAVKHYLADFILQTNWMARGKEHYERWFVPLLAHVGVHAGITLLICLAVAPALWWLTLVDLVVHLATDRSKTMVAHWGGWKPDQVKFWWLLGLDQTIHQLTNIGLAVALVLLS